MIAKYHHATTDGYSIDMGGPWWPDVELWGDGSARREFLHVDDLAEACYTCMKDYNDPEPINVGTGEDITIKELASMISDVLDILVKQHGILLNQMEHQENFLDVD